MQSQQIREALPRTVTHVSLRYPQLLCVFAAFSRNFTVMPLASTIFSRKFDRRIVPIKSGDERRAMTPCMLLKTSAPSWQG
jgi:hypothetical protein